MDIPPGTSGVAGGLIAFFLLKWLSGRAAKQPPEISEGKHVLSYGKAIKILSWPVALIGVSAIFLASVATEDALWLRCMGAGIMCSLCLGLFVEVRCIKILFDEQGLVTISPWRRRRVIPWSALIRYSYSNMNQWHFFHTQGYGKVRLSVLLSGLDAFYDAVLKWGKVVGIERWRRME